MKKKEKHFRRLGLKFNRMFHFQRRKEAGTVRPAHHWDNNRGKALKKHYEKARTYIKKARALRTTWMRI